MVSVYKCSKKKHRTVCSIVFLFNVDNFRCYCSKSKLRYPKTLLKTFQDSMRNEVNILYIESLQTATLVKYSLDILLGKDIKFTYHN